MQERSLNPGREGEESEPGPASSPVNFSRSSFGGWSSKGREQRRACDFPHGFGDQSRVWRPALRGRDSGEVPAAVRPAESGHHLLGLHHYGPGGQRQAGQGVRCGARLCRVGRWVELCPGLPGRPRAPSPLVFTHTPPPPPIDRAAGGRDPGQVPELVAVRSACRQPTPCFHPVPRKRQMNGNYRTWPLVIHLGIALVNLEELRIR